mmetsp:Transcript_7706/g.25544  ORF Transcript_7706/g.25544 Transcript_7706/m.25544 type:complete len:235 (+) Transcript_7706:102-806(+)
MGRRDKSPTYWHRTIGTFTHGGERVGRPTPRPLNGDDVYGEAKAPKLKLPPRLMRTVEGRPEGLAHVAWPNSMGSFNPLTGHWILPPKNERVRNAPKGVFPAARKHLTVMPCGKFNPVLAEWIERPTSKRAELTGTSGKVTIKMCPPPARTGNFNPLTGKWIQPPPDKRAMDAHAREGRGQVDRGVRFMAERSNDSELRAFVPRAPENLFAGGVKQFGKTNVSSLDSNFLPRVK